MAVRRVQHPHVDGQRGKSQPGAPLVHLGRIDDRVQNHAAVADAGLGTVELRAASVDGDAIRKKRKVLTADLPCRSKWFKEPKYLRLKSIVWGVLHDEEGSLRHVLPHNGRARPAP